MQMGREKDNVPKKKRKLQSGAVADFVRGWEALRGAERQDRPETAEFNSQIRG